MTHLESRIAHLEQWQLQRVIAAQSARIRAMTDAELNAFVSDLFQVGKVIQVEGPSWDLSVLSVDELETLQAFVEKAGAQIPEQGEQSAVRIYIPDNGR